MDWSTFNGLQLEDGAPMHNERELRHMEDVKNLMQAAWKVWGAGFIIVILLILMLWRVGGASVALQGLMVSSRGMIILMVVFSIGVAFAFGVLFVGFHRIFFEGSTWIFPYSDTFIRLYPERFARHFRLCCFYNIVRGNVDFPGCSLFIRQDLE